MPAKKATKADLLQNRLGATEEVEVEGVGTVTVRSASREAVIRAETAAAYNDLNQYDVIMLASGIVEPEVSEQEVGEWRKSVRYTEIRPVMDAILRLSGKAEDSPDPKGSSPETPSEPSSSS